MENKFHKYKLVCRPGQKSLLLYDFVPYAFQNNIKDGKADNALKILEREPKNLLTISLPQLVLGVHAAESFYDALVKPSKSRFTASPGLSDINLIRCYICAVIKIEKKFNFFSGFYQLDTLFFLVLAPKMVDKVTCCYFYLPLEQADKFHAARTKQEIAQLDIIVSQATNCASAFIIALAQVTKQEN